MVHQRQVIGVLDTPFSNSASVINVLNFLEFDSYKIKDSSNVKNFEKIIIPGIGNFEKMSNYLRDKNFYNEIIDHYDKNKFLLSICLGFQILFASSEEGEKAIGLNLYSNRVKKFLSGKTHMGWNRVKFDYESRLFDKEDFKDKFFYFVHNYYVKKNEHNPFKYGYTHFDDDTFISYLEDKNIFGLQFHPEKSQQQGVKIIKNFCLL